MVDSLKNRKKVGSLNMIIGALLWCDELSNEEMKIAVNGHWPCTIRERQEIHCTKHTNPSA